MRNRKVEVMDRIFSNGLKIYFVLSFLLSLSQIFVVNSEERQDSLADFPTYDKIYNIVTNATQAIDIAWQIINNLTKEESLNRSYINRKIWPKVLSKYRHGHKFIKEMYMDIIFRRRPSSFLDALLNINSLKQLQNLAKKPKSEPYGYVKLRWMEISTISTQIHRFYNKRMRDIFNGGPNMYDVMNSLHIYRGFVWSSSLRNGSHEPVKYNYISEFVHNKLFLDDGTDAFDGLKKLMEMNPEVLSKPQYDPNSCGPGQRYIRIEPNGNDIPYYLLFYLCLVDLKYYLLSNIIFSFNQLFYHQKFTNQTLLQETMNARIKKKVQLFDEAFGKNLSTVAPSYSTYPGITTCDPPPVSPTNPVRAWDYEISYIKLTNFIKVFISPEQQLHKSGTCRVTCDLLDATYSVCPKNDTDCVMERERECYYHPSRCEKFKPVCPTGAYQCQNSSGKISACPSTRFDRLYEYINGEDVDEGFHFGPRNLTTCNETMKVWQGGWRMEEDILVSTPHFCEICVCYCFEPLTPLLGNETTRYFSLKSMRANIKENRIIIGIKFVRIQDQIHLAIADAVALPGNRVDLSTIKWNSPKYEEDPKFLQRLNMDYRSLNLDDVVSIEPDRVITGIRFYTETYIGVVQYNYIGIEVLTHKIDVKGNLVNGTGIYIRNNNSTVHRKLYQYPDDPDGPDDPVTGPGASLPDSHSNQYIVFRGSSLEKDAAQSTIPYFDSQPLMSPEPKWLKGLGILHKAKHGYGGFLVFKLIEHQF